MTTLEIQSFMMWLTGEESLFPKAEKLTTEQVKLWNEMLSEDWVSKQIAFDAARELAKINKGRSPNFEVLVKLLERNRPGINGDQTIQYPCVAMQLRGDGSLGSRHSFTIASKRELTIAELTNRGQKYAERLKRGYGGDWSVFTNVSREDLTILNKYLAEFKSIPASLDTATADLGLPAGNAAEIEELAF